MTNLLPLTHLAPGEEATVRRLRLPAHEKQRLQDLGLIPGTHIQKLYASFSGDPVAYAFRGAVFALRHATAGRIAVQRQNGRHA